MPQRRPPWPTSSGCACAGTQGRGAAAAAAKGTALWLRLLRIMRELLPQMLLVDVDGSRRGQAGGRGGWLTCVCGGERGGGRREGGPVPCRCTVLIRARCWQSLTLPLPAVASGQTTCSRPSAWTTRTTATTRASAPHSWTGMANSCRCEFVSGRGGGCGYEGGGGGGCPSARGRAGWWERGGGQCCRGRRPAWSLGGRGAGGVKGRRGGGEWGEQHACRTPARGRSNSEGGDVWLKAWSRQEGIRIGCLRLALVPLVMNATPPLAPAHKPTPAPTRPMGCPCPPPPPPTYHPHPPLPAPLLPFPSTVRGGTVLTCVKYSSRKHS